MDLSIDLVIMPGFVHVPTLPLHYASQAVPVKDGMPKFKDLPAEFGGSGEMRPD